jgi:hypothetical protein
MSRYETRADWDKHHFSNEAFPPWRIATWPERGCKVLVWVLGGVFFVSAIVAFFVVLGMMGDNYAQRSEEHDRCMKQATNGYEIERCR